MIDQTEVLKTDVLVVGAGPAGSTYARFLCQAGRKVLLMDAGPQVGPRPGVHLKNLYSDPGQIHRFDQVIQTHLHPICIAPGPTPASPPDSTASHPDLRTRPRTNQSQNLEGACAAYAVGGMALLWTCAIPRHHPTMERIQFISPDEWQILYCTAELLLNKHTNLYELSVRNTLVRSALANHYSRLVAPYEVQNLPLAAERSRTSSKYVYFTGTDRILSPILDSPHDPIRSLLTIVPGHQVRKLHIKAGRIQCAEVYDLTSGITRKIYADTFIVTAGTVMSAQLLWASGLRLPALGRYMIEHPLATAQVVLSEKLLEYSIPCSRHAGHGARERCQIPKDDPPPSVWIPVSEARPWHCQVYRGNCALPADADERHVVDLRWFAMMEPRPDNRVHFSDDVHNEFGMPQPTFEFRYSDGDCQRMQAMMDDMTEAARVLGTAAPCGEPRFMPPGRCLHIQGTCRMGQADNGESVVDANSKVWGIDNLYVGGNSVIPTANACNPTLTNVALATKSAWSIVGKQIEAA